MDRVRVLRLAIPPYLEKWAAERFEPDLLIIDHGMADDMIMVTPLAYAEHINVTIGFVNPGDKP
jgi:hypothetical protein